MRLLRLLSPHGQPMAVRLSSSTRSGSLLLRHDQSARMRLSRQNSTRGHGAGVTSDGTFSSAEASGGGSYGGGGSTTSGAGSQGHGEWTEEEDALLYARVAQRGMQRWSEVATAINNGRRGGECQVRWAEVLDEQLKEARGGQAAHKGAMETERLLTELGSELMGARRRLALASRQAASTAASSGAMSSAKGGSGGVGGSGGCAMSGGAASARGSREAMNAMKVGAFDDTANSGKQLELRVGQCLLKLTDRQERSLKLENAVILEEFSHLQLPQPSWMARERACLRAQRIIK